MRQTFLSAPAHKKILFPQLTREYHHCIILHASDPSADTRATNPRAASRVLGGGGGSRASVGHGDSDRDETGWARAESCGTIQRMRAFTAIVERCSETGLFVGYVPGLAGAHSQGETIEQLRENLREVLEMLIEDGEPHQRPRKLGFVHLRR